jgi:hypothetical protein
MALYEVALNAFRHGEAGCVTIESTSGAVVLRDEGQPFGLAELRQSGRGGNRAVMELDRHAAGTFSMRYEYSDGCNEWTLVDEVLTSGAGSPCAFAPPPDAFGPFLRQDAYEKIPELVKTCQEIHVYPNFVWSWSDWFDVIPVLEKELGGRQLVIHLLPAEDPLAAMVAEHIPGTTFPD